MTSTNAPIPGAPSRRAQQFVVRMPPGLRDALKQQAVKNQRSLNAEIVFHLLAAAQPLTTEGPQQ